MDDYSALLARYGVSTPMLEYAGAPKPEDESSPEYQALLTKYDVDRAQYDAWLNEYQRRKAAWNMYGPDYQGELLGKPEYTYGYEEMPTVIAPPTTETVVEEEQQPAVQIYGSGDSYSGGNTNSSPLGQGASLSLQNALLDGYALSENRAVQIGLPVVSRLANFGFGVALDDQMDRIGQSMGVLGSVSPENDGIGVRSDENANTSTFSNQATIDAQDRATFGVTSADLDSSRGMGGGYDGSGHDQSSDGASGGSRDGDSSHGSGYMKKGGLVGLHQKYSGGGVVIGGGQRLSPELQAAIRADAEANGIENPTTKFEGGSAYGYQPTPRPQAAPAQQAPSPEELSYAAEMEASRREYKDSQAQLNDYLKQALTQRSEGPSKAEMYFQLAAAFAAPTRTGSFGESMGEASKVLGAHQKEIRQSDAANRAAQMQIGLEMAKNRAAGAKEDMGTLRQLTVEEMKARRLANMPQSEIGKAAMDAGMRPGTPEYAQHVSGLITENQGLKTSADVLRRDAAQLALGREQRMAAQAGKLTPPELKLKEETEDTIAAATSALTALDKALKLNPQTFTGSLGDMAQKYALGVVDPSHPKVKATEEQENLLANQALSSLKTLVGGNPTEGERKVIMDLQGIASKSLPVREGIIKNAIQATQNRLARNQKRLADIQSGAYRETSPEVIIEGAQ